MKKIIPLLFTVSLSLFAQNECAIPKDIMKSLLMAESLNNSTIGYEYFIRVNGTKNYKKSKKVLKENIKDKSIKIVKVKVRDKKTKKFKMVEAYLYDCKNKTNCIKITKKLIDNKIINLDLGAYQTNYRYHKYELQNYFSFDSSYRLACKYQHELINQYGWSWETVAKYHSKTPSLNLKYKKILIANYKKITSKRQN